MPLSDDQKAMLRLLAQREQGYEDIGALMGLSVEEVRAKVKEALDQLEEPGGLAGAAPRAPRPEKVPAPPEKTEEPPPPPRDAVPETSSVPARPASKPRFSPPSWASLSSDRRVLAAVGGAVVVVLIVLLATGTFSGGGSPTPTASSSSTTSANSTTAAGSSQQLTQAVLAPVNGGSAQGRALFGRVRNTPVLEVVAQGLTPSPQGQSYTVWLYHSPKLVLRVGGVTVGKSGGISAQFPIPAQLLAYVASGAFDQIDVSLTPDAAYSAEVAQAKKQKRLPRYTGTDILRGKITGPAIKK